jgi:tetratricopeptide (TPR) repeat protein
VLVSCVLLLATASAAHAQRDLTALEGTVVDENGAPLEGARVTARDVERGTKRGDETDGKGRFRIRGLRAGEYEVLVEKDKYQGFKETLRLRLAQPTKREYQIRNLITPAHAAFLRGVEAFNASNFEEAAKAFEESIELAPEVVDGHANLAATYARLGRDDDALKELQQVNELSPDSFEAKTRLAATYAQMNLLDEAIATYEQALAMEHEAANPDVHDAWLNLGTLYFMKERTEDAIAAFDNALVANPSSAKALLSLGKCYFNVGNTDEAIANFEKVLEVAPQTSEATEAQGYIDEFKQSQQKVP